MRIIRKIGVIVGVVGAIFIVPLISAIYTENIAVGVCMSFVVGLVIGIIRDRSLHDEDNKNKGVSLLFKKVIEFFKSPLSKIKRWRMEAIRNRAENKMFYYRHFKNFCPFSPDEDNFVRDYGIFVYEFEKYHNSRMTMKIDRVDACDIMPCDIVIRVPSRTEFENYCLLSAKIAAIDKELATL